MFLLSGDRVLQFCGDTGVLGRGVVELVPPLTERLGVLALQSGQFVLVCDLQLLHPFGVRGACLGEFRIDGVDGCVGVLPVFGGLRQLLPQADDLRVASALTFASSVDAWSVALRVPRGR